jgi:hypothetical protein
MTDITALDSEITAGVIKTKWVKLKVEVFPFEGCIVNLKADLIVPKLDPSIHLTNDQEKRFVAFIAEERWRMYWRLAQWFNYGAMLKLYGCPKDHPMLVSALTELRFSATRKPRIFFGIDSLIKPIMNGDEVNGR